MEEFAWYQTTNQRDNKIFQKDDVLTSNKPKEKNVLIKIYCYSSIKIYNTEESYYRSLKVALFLDELFGLC